MRRKEGKDGRDLRNHRFRQENTIHCKLAMLFVSLHVIDRSTRRDSKDASTFVGRQNDGP
jgi:hypothetical protein